MSQADNHPLLNRSFTGDLQKAFSRLAGDFNPMHDDPVLARRTLGGEQVVHGIHQALAALEAAIDHRRREGGPARGVAELKAVFKKPVLVGETAHFHLAASAPDGCHVAVRVQEETVCDVRIQWAEGTAPARVDRGDLPPLRSEIVQELTFAELAGRTGSLELGLDHALAEEMFPLALALLGPAGLAGVLALSRLVGMHCPGLHSLFSECAVAFRETGEGTRLNYRVDKTDERFGRVAMEVTGPRIEGRVIAFFRPPPEPQPGMAEVARRVEPRSFAGSTSLIIGGSRGLGEITARLIAAGGGLPIITWHRGSADAEQIAADIRSAGGRCEVAHLDVRHSDVAIPRAFAEGGGLRTLYYFATPRIFGRRRGFFDHDLLREFQEVYVSAFGRLVDHAAASGPLRVFYPSSVAVAENMREMAEYAMAKRMGEELCEFYKRHSKQVKILVERLPRIRTDQTSTLMPVPAEDALDVMLPIVRRMELPG